MSGGRQVKCFYRPHYRFHRRDAEGAERNGVESTAPRHTLLTNRSSNSPPPRDVVKLILLPNCAIIGETQIPITTEALW